VPAVFGSVVHASIERIVRALHERGCGSLGDECAVLTLRELGGYSVVVEHELDAQLATFADNPRAEAVLAEIEATARARVPEMRHRVQAILGRTTIARGSSASRHPANGDEGPRPLGEGSHPEVELHSGTLPIGGRADLITIQDGTCTITDFKTGEPSDGHIAQLHLYALLWAQDQDVNPSGLPVRDLILIYPREQVRLAPPRPDEQGDEAARLRARIETASRDLEERPPSARPSTDVCAYCDVRQLCDPYWRQVASKAGDERQGDVSYADCELRVVERNGARSWKVEDLTRGGSAILRTRTEQSVFRAGQTFRALRLSVWREDASDSRVLSETRFSEVFPLDAKARSK
jgi:hypothetical protein